MAVQKSETPFYVDALQGAVLSTILWFILYGGHFVSDAISGLVFGAVAYTSAVMGFSIMPRMKPGLYLRGLVQRLAGAAVAGFLFFTTLNGVGFFLGLDPLPVSIHSLLFIGRLNFWPVFIAAGLIELYRLHLFRRPK